MHPSAAGQRYKHCLLALVFAFASSSAALLSGVGGVAQAASVLSVNVTSSPNPVASGAQLTYTITTTNTGGASVSGTSLSDQVNGMTGLILTSTVGTCSQTNNLVTCKAGTLAGGQSWTVTIRGTVTASSGTTLNDTATATCTKSSQTFTASATVATQVNGGSGSPLPDLTVSITAPASVAATSPFAYTLTVNNVGTANATNIAVQDTLPTTAGYVSTTTSSLFACTASGGIVTCTGGAVNAGSNATITINVTAPNAAGSITDTAVVNPTCSIAEISCSNNTASATTTVTTSPPPPGSLTITKTGAPNPVATGGQETYTVTVKNTSSLTANHVTVSDGTQGLDAASISASTTAGSCTVSAPTVTCVAPKSQQVLDAGASMVITIKGTVVAAPGSTIINTATVNGNIGNQGITNTATVKTSVRPSIDLTVTQALTSPTAPSPVRARDAFTYVLTVGNSGLYPATNVTVREPLPAGVLTNPQTPATAFYTATGGFACSVDAANVLLCTGGTVHGNTTGGTTETITVNLVAPNAIGNITSTATVDPFNAIPETDETNNTFTTTTYVDTGIDLAVSQMTTCFQATHPSVACPTLPLPGSAGGSAPAVAPSGIYSYVITVPNNGTQDASNILVRDILPTGVTFHVATGDHNFTCSQSSGIVDCAGGNIRGTSTPHNPIDKATITIEVAAPAQPGTLTNQVIVDPNNAIPEIDETNNISTQLQLVKLGGGGGFVDLLIPTLTSSPNPIAPSGVLDYTLVAENQGTDTAFNVTVQDTLPAGTIFRSAQDTGSGAGSFTCTQAGGIVTCTGGTLVGTDYNTPLGTPGTRTITIEVFAPTQPGTITDNALVDPANAIAEADETNNANSTSTTVKLGGGGTFIDLTASLTASAGTGVAPYAAGANHVVPGGAITYALTVSNIGTADAFNVEANDILPASTIFVSATDTGTGGFTCGQANGIVDCTGGYLPAGGSETISIVANAPNQASAFPQANVPTDITLIDQAKVDPNNLIPEGNETNNSATWQTKVHSDIDLTVKQSGPDTATQSSNATYTLTVTNNGTADASGVVVHDPLPVGLIETSVDQSPANAFACQISQNPVNVVDCTGDLAGGASVTINIQVFVTATDGTTFSNQACVDPNNTIVEYDETNNCSTVSTTVGHVNMTINKSAGTTTVTPGGTEQYTLLVSNIGTAQAAANDVTVTDDLSTAGLTVSGTPTTTNGFTCTVTNTNTLVTCTNSGAALAAGSSAVITINTLVPTTATGQIVNTASVTAGDDTGSANKSDSATISVGAPTVDLAVQSVTGAPGAVAPGQTLVYTVQAANLGTGAATSSSVLIRNSFNSVSGLTLVSAVGTNGFTCGTLSGTNLDCSSSAGLGAAGSSGSPASATTLTLRFMVDSGATNPLVLTSTIDPNNVYTQDTNTANNSASATTTVSASAACSPSPCKDLATTILGSPNPVTSGGTVTYSVTVGNIGTENLTGAAGSPAVTEYINLDPTAGGVTVTNVTGGAGLANPWACDTYPVVPALASPGTPTTLVCHGDLTAGQGAVITLTATVGAASGSTFTSTVIADPNQNVETTPDALDTDTSAIAVQ